LTDSPSISAVKTLAGVDTRPEPVTNVPVGWTHLHPTGPLVVRVASVADASACRSLDLTRLVWIETPLHLAEEAFPEGAPLDVVVSDPEHDAPRLYTLTRIRDRHPVRVTVPGRPGIARASRIAMALHFPVRLLVPQPSPDVLAELDGVIDLYLHDSQTSAPVEFLQSALAWWLHGDAPPPWIALELDPWWFPRVADDGAPVDVRQASRAPDFVATHFARLNEDRAECATCRHGGWCLGFFKWPDPSYRCDGVVRLLARLEDSAAQLARDLDEAPAP
jgi:hypothetical protein